MICSYYNSHQCRSCSWLEKPYARQIHDKQAMLSQKLNEFNPEVILDPIMSEQVAFRNKAKMAVLGTVEKPILGIMTDGNAVDLCDCPLYSPVMRSTLYQLRTLIKQLQLVPYNIRKKKGEIKFIILTEAKGQFMLRIVLRSEKEQSKITHALAEIQQNMPQLIVISINIQPEHSAVLEGPQEFILTQQQQFPITMNNIPLFIQKGSFFQTNTAVASQLYATAKQWLDSLNVNAIWDLFCGVGGFGLHCITAQRQLTGIEINQEAIACAKLSARLMDYNKISFQSLDAAKFAYSQPNSQPDLVLVNPPRRGLGQALADYLHQMSSQYILYSSCNLDSLVADLKVLTQYQIQCVQLFDMFPHTEHMEILVLLKNTQYNKDIK
ncbi:23S rRNA m(5)U-747 methyltransferase [Orbus hercynius]|uniref:23S rRNA (uracil(747)-C(5))-methyltransferase RlmC n=1 Tax=Orbus hercynius TaxID=593135 RepID=A0A495RLS1_9GAMM|nr:23S rRNA (uracil(747)-C(5))-methyltransferase RlmC [Orbus hercynius]RKS87758.1 23S rRNA m(5)U-747 methyltransferase [Orbus hercynius]